MSKTVNHTLLRHKLNMIQISPESYKISLASKETNTLQGKSYDGVQCELLQEHMDDRMRLDATDLNAYLLFVSRRSGGSWLSLSTTPWLEPYKPCGGHFLEFCSISFIHIPNMHV